MFVNILYIIAVELGQHADAFPLLQNLITNQMCQFESTHLTSSCQALTCVAGVTNGVLTINKSEGQPALHHNSFHT